MKLSFFLMTVFGYCNAQLFTNHNEQWVGKMKSGKSVCKAGCKAEDLMDKFVYQTLLRPMLQAVDMINKIQMQNKTNKMKGAVLFKSVTESVSTLKNGGFMQSSKCTLDLEHFNIDLQNGELYTLMMFDAYGKIPPGILKGSITWPGLYDQCQSQVSNMRSFRGNQCLVYLVNTTQYAVFENLNVGVCVPDSCDGNDIKYLLNLLPIDTNGYEATNVICNKNFEYSTPAICCLSLLAFMGMFVIVGTAFDFGNRRRVQQKCGTHGNASKDNENLNEETPLLPKNNDIKNNRFYVKFLLCFSLLINGSKILKTQQGEDSLGAINGIRVISLWWVILGHTFSTAVFLFTNILTSFDAVTRFTFQAIVNGTFSVDSFFVLSGLLTTYLTLIHMKKNNGKMNWAMFYIHRYIRLTPVYAVVIFIYVSLTPHFASGPIYSSTFDPYPAPGVENQVTYCQKYWWTNLLYINNLHPSKLAEECLSWGWYLANDMQFFLISPLILYSLYHYLFFGILICITILLACFGSLIGLAIKNDITTKFFPDYPGQKTLTADEIYVRPWARIAAYIVGIAVGYILYKYKRRVQMSQYLVLLGWMAAAVTGLAVVYGLYGNYHNHQLNDVATVIYITLSRFSWSVALGWVIFACATGHGGPVNLLLSWSFWIPLSRINYCAYLLHPMIITVFYLSLPNLIYYTDSIMAYFYLGNIVLSYAAAFLLSIFVEAPFLSLEKLLLKKDRRA